MTTDTTPEPVRTDDHGDGTSTVWMCQPPADGEHYIPTLIVWSTDSTTRTVHEWVPA